MSTTMNAQRDRIAESAGRFARETADHELTIIKDDGLYRHVRFARPKGNMAWWCWFDLITWPGNLVIRGDCGTYIFSRTDDMFGFFRLDGGQINPGYWAEKTPGGERSVQSYSEEVFLARLGEVMDDFEATARPGDLTAARAIIAEYKDAGLAYESDARALLDELEGLVDGVTDTWEWNFTDWDWSYLWCCHAIVYGIAQYDAAKALQAARRPSRTAALWRHLTRRAPR